MIKTVFSFFGPPDSQKPTRLCIRRCGPPLDGPPTTLHLPGPWKTGIRATKDHRAIIRPCGNFVHIPFASMRENRDSTQRSLRFVPVHGILVAETEAIFMDRYVTGAVIRRMREARGLTQEDLAEQFYVSSFMRLGLLVLSKD